MISSRSVLSGVRPAFNFLGVLLLLSAELPLRAGPVRWVTDLTKVFSDYKDRGVDVGEPIAANSGAHYFSMPLFNLGGIMPLSYALHYRLDHWRNWDLSSNFQSNINILLVREIEALAGRPDVQVHLRNGHTPVFRLDGETGMWELDEAAEVRFVLKETGDDGQGYFYLMDPMLQQVYVFEKVSPFCGANTCPARIVYLLDRNSNRLTWSYAAGGFGGGGW